MSATQLSRPEAASPQISFAQPQLVVRRARYSARMSRRSMIVIAALAGVSIVIGLVSLATGSYALDLGQVVGALTGRESGIVQTIVVQWRLPRVLLAVLFGLALGLSGAIFQSLTRNPLGSPDIIGFDTGAYTGALIVMLVLHSGGMFSVTFGALLGGLATAAVVYLFAYRRGVQGFRLIIVGIGITAMLTSVNVWLLLHADQQQAVAAAFWGAGSLGSAGDPQLIAAAVVFAIVFPCAAVLSRGIRMLELGDDLGRQLGVRAERVRLAAVVVGVAASATVTALAGPIAFIALAAPQIGRRLTRSAGVSLGAAAATGCVLLLAADWIAQNALPTSLPTGLVTVVLGGGYFLWLLISEGRRA